MMNRLPVFLLLLLLGGTSAHAAYITDKLVAGLYEKAEITEKPLKALNTGTPLEVISREKDFIKVRTPDGTEGWVEAAYLTDEKPARSMLLDLQAKNALLQKKLESAGKSSDGQTPPVQSAANAARIEELADNLAELQNSNRELAAANSELQAKNTRLQQQQQQIGEILQLKKLPADVTSANLTATSVVENYPLWLLAGLAGGLLLTGLLGGVYLMRRRIRKRFGTVLQV